MAEINQTEMSADPGRRLFLACWPDQTLQNLLYDLARHLQLKHGGRRTRKENIHLTLVFLGQVHQQKERQLRERLRTLDIKQFDLELDKAGAFTHCRINWVGPRVVPHELQDLHHALKLISHEIGFHTEDRAYQPHITVLRKSHGDVDHAIKPIPWKVDRYCLIESKQTRDGVDYEIIEEFPLTKH